MFQTLGSLFEILGGRMLDGVLSVVKVLLKILDLILGRLSVLADWGAHSGLDVLKMLALGTDTILLRLTRVVALAAGDKSGVN
tara:strand:+ start:16269 stop:16517 length:249 start_codon:yes stop_codon:yes gene_type:complete